MLFWFVFVQLLIYPTSVNPYTHMYLLNKRFRHRIIKIDIYIIYESHQQTVPVLSGMKVDNISDSSM
jgi:hypothetical protein